MARSPNRQGYEIQFAGSGEKQVVAGIHVQHGPSEGNSRFESCWFESGIKCDGWQRRECYQWCDCVFLRSKWGDGKHGHFRELCSCQFARRNAYKYHRTLEDVNIGLDKPSGS